MRNAKNGKSILWEGAREGLLVSWEQSSPKEGEVHPGAGLLKASRQIRRRALNALREKYVLLSRVEPRINSSLRWIEPRFVLYLEEILWELSAI